MKALVSGGGLRSPGFLELRAPLPGGDVSRP